MIAAMAESYFRGHKTAVYLMLEDVAEAHPQRVRKLVKDSAEAVAAYFCTHGDTPPAPLLHIEESSSGERSLRYTLASAAFTTRSGFRG